MGRKQADKVKGIFKRGDIYWIRYTYEGREYRESAHCTTVKGAKKFQSKRLAALCNPDNQGNISLPTKRVKFEDLAKAFSKHCENDACWNSKRYLVAGLVSHFAGRTPNQITKTELERFVQKHEAKGDKGSTINRYLSALSHMLSFGSDERMVSEHTRTVLRKFQRFDETQYQRKVYLTPEQCTALLVACKDIGEHLFGAALVAIYTGLRQYDVLNLRWRDIHYVSDKMISITIHKTKKPLDLPIPDTLYRYLLEQSKAGVSLDDYLIAWRGKRITSVRKSFAHALHVAGITSASGVRFHDLRHTFASFVARTEPLQVVAKFLGHTTLRCTLRYGHICDEQMIGASAKVDKLIQI
ncbi:tyrosine-type recombinase/integrase [Oryzomonas rubra]|uniref:Site-specific integrase n=1 Tax=Oryzomonas rubra TaxID=2509454 RepID=A0A5A9XSA4_9BACT|nr:site-specific integrase [Oryzomonas rubra]KAA0895453.1 site-specific integrase [Oryzomonas rubra]